MRILPSSILPERPPFGTIVAVAVNGELFPGMLGEELEPGLFAVYRLQEEGLEWVFACLHHIYLFPSLFSTKQIRIGDKVLCFQTAPSRYECQLFEGTVSKIITQSNHTRRAVVEDHFGNTAKVPLTKCIYDQLPYAFDKKAESLRVKKLKELLGDDWPLNFGENMTTEGDEEDLKSSSSSPTPEPVDETINLAVSTIEAIKNQEEEQIRAIEQAHPEIVEIEAKIPYLYSELKKKQEEKLLAASQEQQPQSSPEPANLQETQKLETRTMMEEFTSLEKLEIEQKQMIREDEYDRLTHEVQETGLRQLKSKIEHTEELIPNLPPSKEKIPMTPNSILLRIKELNDQISLLSSQTTKLTQNLSQTQAQYIAAAFDEVQQRILDFQEQKMQIQMIESRHQQLMEEYQQSEFEAITEMAAIDDTIQQLDQDIKIEQTTLDVLNEKVQVCQQALDELAAEATEPRDCTPNYLKQISQIGNLPALLGRMVRQDMFKNRGTLHEYVADLYLLNLKILQHLIDTGETNQQELDKIKAQIDFIESFRQLFEVECQLMSLEKHRLLLREQLTLIQTECGDDESLTFADEAEDDPKVPSFFHQLHGLKGEQKVAVQTGTHQKSKRHASRTSTKLHRKEDEKPYYLSPAYSRKDLDEVDDQDQQLEDHFGLQWTSQEEEKSAKGKRDYWTSIMNQKEIPEDQKMPSHEEEPFSNPVAEPEQEQENYS